ncbi:MAG: hypothetical protein HKP27_07085, partial [Myxococcales bacterium]|nr:hypothetical protein [Myxococcales bacterium]
MDPFANLCQDLHDAGVRFVTIGVWGANYYAHSGATLFTTQDRDLFMPPEPTNLLAAWRTCEACGLDLVTDSGPLDVPRDSTLARAVVDRRASTRATDGQAFDVDLTLVMSGFDFDSVWSRRRTFVVDDVEIPVASLSDIVAS